MTLTEELLALVAERKALFVDQEANDPQIDIMAKQVVEFIKKHKDQLSLEVIIESLTHLGSAPNILYDDNGHFTVAEEGSQNLPTTDDDFETKETEFHASWTIPPGGWKKTIREALNAYLDQEEE